LERKVYRIGEEFRFEPGRRVLKRSGGAAVALPARAYDLLAVLVQQRHRAVTKDELCSEVWTGVTVTPNNLNQCITALRKAFGDTRQESRFIATIPNVGYQFVAPVEVIDEQEEAPRGGAATPADSLEWRKPAVRFHHRWLAAAGACLLLASCLLIASKWPNGAVPEIAVAAFANLQKDDDYDWLANALRELAGASFLNAREHSAAPFQLRGSFSIPSEGKIRIRVALLKNWRKTGSASRVTGLLADRDADPFALHEASSGRVLGRRRGPLRWRASPLW